MTDEPWVLGARQFQVCEYYTPISPLVLSVRPISDFDHPQAHLLERVPNFADQVRVVPRDIEAQWGEDVIIESAFPQRPRTHH